MSLMTTPESRARLGYLLAEMLSLPSLPADLNQMISDHLQQQISLVNILKPEYCLRLYPILAELAELSAKENESQASAEAATPAEEPVAAIAESISDVAQAEVVNGSESMSDAAPAEVVNGAAHEQADHFNQPPTEQASEEERSESY